MILDDFDAEAQKPIELQGHNEILAKMLASADSERGHHSWVLSGPKGIGKARLALEFAAELMAKPQNSASLFGDGSGNEKTSQIERNLVYQKTHPDFLYIDAEISETNKSGQIRIEQIRKINQFFANSSARGGWRIVIIDSMDEVNVNGANALLKILEEPPEKAMILLITSAKSKLLPTIRSRCYVQTVMPLSKPASLLVLRQRFEDADIGYLEQLATLSSGAPGQAVFLSKAGALEAYEQSCQILADQRTSLNHMMMLGALWGEGGAKAGPKRVAGAYLFDRLFSQAAISCAAGGELEDYLPYEAAAIDSLARDFSAQSLAEFHEDISAVFSDSARFYLDAAAVFQPLLLKIYKKSI